MALDFNTQEIQTAREKFKQDIAARKAALPTASTKALKVEKDKQPTLPVKPERKGKPTP